jgi:hypothetical protein
VGVGVVLLVYLMLLSVLAATSGGVLMAVTRWYLRTVPIRRVKIARATALFPSPACYSLVWFVGYAIVNDTVFHHDPMIGDGWYTNIGNGYAIDMIDVTDHAVLHTEGDSSSGLNGPGAIDGVRRLQIMGDQIYGTRDTKVFLNFGSGLQGEDSFSGLIPRLM